MKDEVLLDQKVFVRNPDNLIRTKMDSTKKFYHFMEVGNIVQDAMDKAEKRANNISTAKMLDGIAYALTYHRDKFLDPDTCIANMVIICGILNSIAAPTEKIKKSRENLERQTGFIIKDGDIKK